MINSVEGKIAELYIDPFKIDERIRWTSWTKVMRYFLINFKHLITVYAINDKFLWTLFWNFIIFVEYFWLPNN